MYEERKAVFAVGKHGLPFATIILERASALFAGGRNMRKFPKTMSVRLTEQEFEEIKSAAKKLSININAYLRQKVLSE
jgi:hypothetical protein